MFSACSSELTVSYQKKVQAQQIQNAKAQRKINQNKRTVQHYFIDSEGSVCSVCVCVLCVCVLCVCCVRVVCVYCVCSVAIHHPYPL